MAKAPNLGAKFWLQALLAVEIVLILGAFSRLLSPPFFLPHTLVWLRDLGALGVVAFVVLYNLATVLFIPGSILTLGGGALYGVFWGSVYVTLRAILGATLAFLIGRYWARDWVCQRLQNDPRFRSIDAAVARRGARVVLLTWLSPVFPFNLLNYGFGITTISLKDYLLGSLGLVPGTVMYVYIGSLAGDIATLDSSSEVGLQAQLIQWTMRGVGLVATGAVTLYVARIAQKALNEDIRS
jgi:uncharacterized membrane protein YdjX (TVP38/TMEM64 family)